MNNNFTSFDDIVPLIKGILDAKPLPRGLSIYLIRDLYGKVRIVMTDGTDISKTSQNALSNLADSLSKKLGPHSYSFSENILYVEEELLATLEGTRQKIYNGVYLVDRLVTGGSWWTVEERQTGGRTKNRSRRITLFSVKGGVGRTTTVATLAWHLARKGKQVLLVDLDLESPGLSSVMLEEGRRPKFGITDWFVEDLVDQGDHVIGDMTGSPPWAQDLEGNVRIVPAHGKEPGEYLAKLGRVYVTMRGESWSGRLQRLLGNLESKFKPDVTLLESRSGLHDIAAVTITDLEAEVLLFAIDSESTWIDYDILFHHWHASGLARKIRQKLTIVSALTPPPVMREVYLERFREHAWDLFREYLYDAVPPKKKSTRVSEESSYDFFSYDRDEKEAPHDPLRIDWAIDFAHGASLEKFDAEMVSGAYGDFLKRFDMSVNTSNKKERK